MAEKGEETINQDYSFYVGMEKKNYIILFFILFTVIFFFLWMSSYINEDSLNVSLGIYLQCLIFLCLILINLLELKFIEIDENKIIFKYLYRNRKIKWNDIEEIRISDIYGFRMKLRNRKYIASQFQWGEKVESIILELYQKRSTNPIVIR